MSAVFQSRNHAPLALPTARCVSEFTDQALLRASCFVLFGQRVFGANPKSFPALFPLRYYQLDNGLVISSAQIMVFVVTLLLLFALRHIVLHTRIGTAMRALSFNPTAASLVGVNNDRVISFTFALGSALAAAGGILYASNYPSIDPLQSSSRMATSCP